MPARLPSSIWVTGLTVGAIAAVGVLTVQAERGPHPTAAAVRPGASASAAPGAKASASPKASAAPAATEVPEASGTGRRIVYDLSDHRVWLVDADDTARRTFTVWPGTVAPVPGTYTISVRKDTTTGSDGVEIEHIIYFSVVSGVNIAFSNAVDGASPPPATAGAKTGGIRMPKADGSALWAFGDLGTKVRVVE
ncbi:L,D-transpeptidase [Streptomyces sp. NPDC005820]|uniref:L,D-transpeptidase n=1 Tax=Streptomyces sp. NPDC005820 TaxID=3157069 RepID=UPI00340F98CD